MLVLKQSTAVDIRMGPFVDATDGVTPETGITLGAADQAEVLKADGAATVAMGGTFAAVTGADGWYDYTCATGDVDTVGEVVFVVQDSSVCLPVFVRAQVVEEATYDMLYASGATPLADINAECDTAISDAALATASALATVDSNVDLILVDTGTTLDTKLDDIQGATFNSATDSLEALRNRGDAAWTGSATTSNNGTAQAGSASTITLESGASASNDLYNGQVVYISSGTGAGQSRAIGDYVGSTKVATVITDWAVTPDATSVYEIYPDEITEITAAPSAAAIADAIWDENTAGHTSAGTFGEQVKNDIDAILTDTGTTLDSTLSTIDSKIDTIDTNVDAVLVDTNELQTDLTNGGRLDLLIDQIITDVATVDTVVDGIQTDLDNATDGLGALKAVLDSILTDTGTTLDTKIDTIDTVVDAIKAKTDSLTFTVANQVDANAESINATAVVGVGTSGNKWRA